jgi:hypothetical protein
MPGVLSAILGFTGEPLLVQYLVIAGGGGGGSSGTNYGGGGGAGGYRSSVLGEVTGGGGSPEQRFNAVLGTQYAVAVGGGGPAGTNGVNSSIFGIVSTGGGAGRGSAYGAQGFTGGSGGGGTYVNGLGGLRTTTPIQGYPGGVGSSAGNPPPQTNAGSGGGGGAGGPGYDLQVPGFNRNSEGSGGLGLQSSITGTPTFYAAGGVGSSYYSTSRTNDIGGGATGGVVGGFVSNVGTINTGSGGGGGVNGAGGVGGSGIIILRYPKTYTIAIGSGLVGTTSLVGTNKVTRLTSGTGNVSFAFARSLSVQYLVVAGGGGAGEDDAGGGGAGGVRSTVDQTGGGGSLEQPILVDPDVNYTVTIGAGGAGATVNTAKGVNGTNSTFFSITSIGGGGGGGRGTVQSTDAAGIGGSGGGGAGRGTFLTGGTGTAGQGFGGATSTIVGYGGGGGGAGGAGGIGAIGQSGVGITTSITGAPVSLGGGGGGGGGPAGAVYTNSFGGGAGRQTGSTHTAGTANTGGGGGATGDPVDGKAGGSGVVILRYPSDFSINFGAGLNASTATSGFDKVTTITAGTGNITFVEGSASIQSALNLSPHTGLIGQFFNGDWRGTIATGNIGTLPLSSPTNYSSISYGTRGDFYGLLAIGYFRPPTTGTYTFFTSSDDGSGVWVGDLASATSGRTAANATLNNNLGGGQGDTKRSGSVALTGGVWYPIRIVHEEGGGGDNLTFSWSGPGIGETTDLSTHFKRPVNLEGTTINTYF